MANEVTELPGRLVGQLHRTRACTPKRVFTPGHVLFPTILGSGERKRAQGYGARGEVWSRQAGRGAGRPGFPACWGEAARGATSSPRQAEATREKKKNRLDLFKWNVMPDFPCTPRGGARASPLLSSGLPQVTQRDPAPNSRLRPENFRYSNPTCSQALTKLALARPEYFSLPPATFLSALCSLHQPGH